MNITLNNRNEKLEADHLTVQELIALKNYTFKFLVTRINGKLIKKEERDKSSIHEGDKVDIIHLISGG